MNWYLKALKQYADFKGRARRREYWFFALFNVVFAIVAVILDLMLDTTILITSLYMLGMIIPGLAVAVRRLHDIGKSGAWILISLVPLVGGIWLLILMLTDSIPGKNQYGENPKGVSAIV